MNTNQDEYIQPGPVDLENPPLKRKRWWKITKTILGYIIPFLIIGSLPLTIWLFSLNADENEPDMEERWEDQEENWDQYLKRAEELGYPSLDTNLLEMDLCPFGENSSSWDESKTPEEAG